MCRFGGGNCLLVKNKMEVFMGKVMTSDHSHNLREGRKESGSNPRERERERERERVKNRRDMLTIPDSSMTGR